MSIPFYFDPIPKYFREKGWFKPTRDNSHLEDYFLIGWSISRTKATTHTFPWHGEEIQLEPFEFICSYETAAAETGMSVDKIRWKFRKWISLGVLIKSEKSKKNKYNVYRWATHVMGEISNSNSYGEHQTVHQTQHQTVHQSVRHQTKKKELRTKKTLFVAIRRLLAPVRL